MGLENFRNSSRSRLNFTERATLTQTAVSISVDPAVKPLTVRINQLDLPASIPDGAQVSVDAYRSSTGHFERLSFGEAKAFKSGAGAGASRPLLRIPTAESLRFRVKIAEAADGRLLAEVDQLRAAEESDERAIDDLFPLIPKALNGELWRVAYDADGPALWVEKALDEGGVFLWTSPAFQALALPAALRQVAERIIRNRDRDEPWFEKWKTFLSQFHVGFSELASEPDDEEPPVSDEDIDNVLAELASAFARKFELVKIGAAALKDGGGE